MADRPRKWWVAVLLTFCALGLGQLYNGRWRKALGFGGASFATLGAFALSAAFMARDAFLVWLAVFLVIGVVLLFGAIRDAFVDARRSSHFAGIESAGS